MTVARNTSWSELAGSPWWRRTRIAYSELEHDVRSELTWSVAVSFYCRWSRLRVRALWCCVLGGCLSMYYSPEGEYFKYTWDRFSSASIGFFTDQWVWSAKSYRPHLISATTVGTGGPPQLLGRSFQKAWNFTAIKYVLFHNFHLIGYWF